MNKRYNYYIKERKEKLLKKIHIKKGLPYTVFSWNFVEGKKKLFHGKNMVFPTYDVLYFIIKIIYLLKYYLLIIYLQYILLILISCSSRNYSMIDVHLCKKKEVILVLTFIILKNKSSNEIFLSSYFLFEHFSP